MLKRMWRALLAISDIPVSIRESGRYRDRDYWIDRAKITDDWMYVGIWFTDGSSDLWKSDNGVWMLHSHAPAKPNT